jgi:hypothetical protein
VATTIPNPAPAVSDADSAALVLREAIAHEAELHDDREVSALASSLYLVTHPDVPVSTDDDYAGTPWAAQLDARIAETQAAWAAAHTKTTGGTA